MSNGFPSVVVTICEAETSATIPSARAEVTARNITLSSDALRERLGVASGGDVHLFGVRIQGGEQVLLVTRRLEDGVRPSLRAYLENAVIPQYAAFEKAHREDHAR